MAIFLGSLNRPALRAAVQPPADDPVVDDPVTGQDWASPPEGYNTAFSGDFSQPVTGIVNGSQSWQGIDRSKWEVPDSKSGNPDGTSIQDTDRWKIRSTNAVVPEEGLLYLYGGRLPENVPGPNAIQNTEFGFSTVAARSNSLYPSRSAPTILRFRQRWEQRKHYTAASWASGFWGTINVGGQTYNVGWEHDIETQGTEYDHANRTFKPHFNNHLWCKVPGGLMSSQMSPMTVEAPLPDDPLAEITLEMRWRRGPDFWDPTQTYVEWYTPEIINGEDTGNMVRRYHWSPRHLLEGGRNKFFLNGSEPAPQPLPGYLAAVAPWKLWKANNTMKGTAPWSSMSDKLIKPLMAAHDPNYTFFDLCDAAWDKNTVVGGAQWWNGFTGPGFFLNDPGPAYVSDYTDHYSYVNQAKLFAAPIRGMAIFHPD